MSMIDKSKTEVLSALSRAKATLANAKKETKQITERAVNSALTVGAGYGVGALRQKFGSGTGKKLFVPGTEIEADLAGGVLLTLAGVAGLGDEKSDTLAAAGAGVLAGYAAISAFNQSA